KRQTYGELLYPLGIGLTALISQDKYIFMAAVLHLALADGLAAIVGIRYGGNTQYRIFGQTKTLIGTATFMFVSMLIIIGLLLWTPYGLMPAQTIMLVSLPLLAAAAENVGVQGLDNVLVPVLVTIALTTN